MKLGIVSITALLISIGLATLDRTEQLKATGSCKSRADSYGSKRRLSLKVFGTLIAGALLGALAIICLKLK
jgi:hypothetical protein